MLIVIVGSVVNAGGNAATTVASAAGEDRSSVADVAFSAVTTELATARASEPAAGGTAGFRSNLGGSPSSLRARSSASAGFACAVRCTMVLKGVTLAL